VSGLFISRAVGNTRRAGCNGCNVCAQDPGGSIVCLVTTKSNTGTNSCPHGGLGGLGWAHWADGRRDNNCLGCNMGSLITSRAIDHTGWAGCDGCSAGGQDCRGGIVCIITTSTSTSSCSHGGLGGLGWAHWADSRRDDNCLGCDICGLITSRAIDHTGWASCDSRCAGGQDRGGGILIFARAGSCTDCNGS
jgi:hypothetical protein